MLVHKSLYHITLISVVDIRNIYVIAVVLENIAECTVQADFTLILDMSGSNEDFFDAMLSFSQQFILGLPVDVGSARVATVIFSTTASVSFPLNQYSTTQQVQLFLAGLTHHCI